jgi:D-lactate dehydrogenase
MAKITFFEIKPWEIKYLKSSLKNHSLRFFEEPINNKNLSKAKDSDIISVFIYSKVSKDTLRKLPSLKLITTRSTGFDHIDTKECKKRKIQVCNVPYYGENTVAEHTFALILSLSRNIHKSYVRTLKDNFSIEGLTGFDLKDKTIGIIGGGHIGLHVARMARAFGMHVRVNDLNKNNFLAEVINFKYVSFEELLKSSDIISLHIP